jgi:hypothetical protein
MQSCSLHGGCCTTTLSIVNLKVLPLHLSATDTTPPASQDRGLHVIVPMAQQSPGQCPRNRWADLVTCGLAWLLRS